MKWKTLVPRFLILAPLFSLLAQTGSSAPGDAGTGAPERIAPQPIPQQTATFSQTTPLTGIPQSPIVASPFGCSPSGSVCLDVFLPPAFEQRTLVSISSTGRTTSFPIPNSFTDPSPVGYSASENHVYVMIEGKKNDPGAVSTNPVAGPPGQSAAARTGQFYLLQFKNDGTFEDAVRIENASPLLRFAAFPSGKLLVAGFEAVNQSPQLVVMDRDGDNRHPLDLGASGLYNSENLRRSFPELQGTDRIDDLARVESNMQFVSYGEHILLVQARTTYPSSKLAREEFSAA